MTIDEGEPQPLVIQHLIDHPDGTQIAFRVYTGPQGSAALEGFDPNASIIYRLSYEVAKGIADGERDAHEEFLLNRLTFSGDPSSLLTHKATLKKMQDCISRTARAAEGGNP